MIFKFYLSIITSITLQISLILNSWYISNPATMPPKFFFDGSINEYPPISNSNTQTLIGKKNNKIVCCLFIKPKNVMIADIDASAPTCGTIYGLGGIATFIQEAPKNPPRRYSSQMYLLPCCKEIFLPNVPSISILKTRWWENYGKRRMRSVRRCALSLCSIDCFWCYTFQKKSV